MYPREKLRQAMALYAVTDRSWLKQRTLGECVEEALRGGATFVQLREKKASSAEMVMRAHVLLPLCRAVQVPFVINDNVEAARISGADGVHVGQSDTAVAEARFILGPDKIVGVSVADVVEARTAQAAGADYLGVGAVFGSSTKVDAPVVSLAVLKEICDAVRIPVVAIGGIGAETVPELAGSGVDGVAAISSIFAADNIETATGQLYTITKATLGLEA